MTNWFASDRDALKAIIQDALDGVPGFTWSPDDIEDASEAVVSALEEAGTVPTVAIPEDAS